MWINGENMWDLGLVPSKVIITVAVIFFWNLFLKEIFSEVKILLVNTMAPHDVMHAPLDWLETKLYNVVYFPLCT